MVDYKEVEKAMKKLEESIAETVKNKPNPLNDDEIKTVFEKNAESIKDAKLSEANLAEIAKIIKEKHSNITSVYIQKALQDFWKKHLVDLEKNEDKNRELARDQRREEEEKKRFISEGSGGNVADPGLRRFDQIKNKKGLRIGEKLYYYVWWVFDSEADYNRVAQNHVYPRDRGKLKVYYKEIGNKEIEEALAGRKSSGRVEGDFLGARGLVRRNEEFTDLVENVELQPGQIVALGAARAKRWDFRTFEWRGLTDSKLMRFDVEKLIWKWAKPFKVGGAGKEEKPKVEPSADPYAGLRSSLEEWKNVYHLEEDQNLSLKWHYDKNDAKILRRIRDWFVALVGGHIINNKLIIRNHDVTNIYNNIIDDLGKVIKAWESENPGLLEPLTQKKQYDLFDRITRMMNLVGEKK